MWKDLSSVFVAASANGLILVGMTILTVKTASGMVIHPVTNAVIDVPPAVGLQKGLASWTFQQVMAISAVVTAM